MTFRNLLRAVALLAGGALAGNAAWAQPYPESEPNSPCEAAQLIGMLSVFPTVVTGELTPTAGEPPGDVDFFLLQAEEGMRLRAGIRGDIDQPLPLGDPYLGLFDADCNLLAVNDNYLDLNSRLTFYVPAGADGYFILAATGCCDGAFVGDHYQQGAYRLRVSIPPDPVTVITGRLVDAVTNAPLPGGWPLFPTAELYRCDVDGCYATVNVVQPDEFGVFRFETDYSGMPLDPGQFLVRAYAADYTSAETGRFDAASNETVELGDIALQPPALVFENVNPCSDIPAIGGRCRYSVDVRNNTETSIKGLGWSNISAYGGSSPLGYILFPADNARRTELAALSTRTLSFSFDVPAGVVGGTFMCPDVWFSDRATDYFGALRMEPLFCVFKRQAEFAIVDARTAAGMMGLESAAAGKLRHLQKSN